MGGSKSTSGCEGELMSREVHDPSHRPAAPGSVLAGGSRPQALGGLPEETVLLEARKSSTIRRFAQPVRIICATPAISVFPSPRAAVVPPHRDMQPAGRTD